MPCESWGIDRQTATVHRINSERAQSGFDERLVTSGKEPLGPPGAIVLTLTRGRWSWSHWRRARQSQRDMKGLQHHHESLAAPRTTRAIWANETHSVLNRTAMSHVLEPGAMDSRDGRVQGSERLAPRREEPKASHCLPDLKWPGESDETPDERSGARIWPRAFKPVARRRDLGERPGVS